MQFLSEVKSLTRVDSIRQQFGSAARHLAACLQELEREGCIEIETTAYFGFERQRYASKKARAGKLNNKQVTLLHEVKENVCGQTARDIRNLSPNLVWQVAKNGERIPYVAVYEWEPAEISDADRAEAVVKFRRLRAPDGRSSACTSPSVNSHWQAFGGQSRNGGAGNRPFAWLSIIT